MRVYISGAITGNGNAEADFLRAEQMLLAKGHQVANPFRVCSSIAWMAHRELMDLCFSMIDKCDAVAFIPGWEGSLGANQEYGYALGKDMSFFFLEM